MKQRISEIIPNINRFDSIKFLDVGCGYGSKTLEIIKHLEKFAVVHTTAIDPSTQLLNLFNQNINNREGIRITQATWEKFQVSEKFDFIMSFHTFYYIDEWESAIEKMVQCTKPRGAICIAIRPDDEVCKFKDYFFQKNTQRDKTGKMS